MATVHRAFGSTVGTLYPGQTAGWYMTPVTYGDAFTVSAHPVTGNPREWNRVLEVRNIRVDGSPTAGLTLRFSVANVGLHPTPGYGVAVGWIAK